MIDYGDGTSSGWRSGSSPSGAFASHTYLVSGTYFPTLTVRKGSQLSNPYPTTVNV